MSAPREIFMGALARERAERPATGSATSIVTRDLMDKVGAHFPDAHIEPETMARLGETGSSELGFDNVMPLFSVWHESAALGAEVDWGDDLHMPECRRPLYRMGDAVSIPRELLDRAAGVLANASREDKASGGIKFYPITSEGRTLYRLKMPSGLDQTHGCSLDINLDPSAGMNVSSAVLADGDGKWLKQLQTVYEKHEGVYLPGSFRYIEIIEDRYIAFERCLELVESSVNSPHFKEPRLDMLGLPEGQLISADGDTPTYILKSGDLVPLPEVEHFSASQAHSTEKTSGKSVYFYATLAIAGIAAMLVWYLLRGPLHS